MGDRRLLTEGAGLCPEGTGSVDGFQAGDDRVRMEGTVRMPNGFSPATSSPSLRPTEPACKWAPLSPLPWPPGSGPSQLPPMLAAVRTVQSSPSTPPPPAPPSVSYASPRQGDHPTLPPLLLLRLQAWSLVDLDQVFNLYIPRPMRVHSIYVALIT